MAYSVVLMTHFSDKISMAMYVHQEERWHVKIVLMQEKQQLRRIKHLKLHCLLEEVKEISSSGWVLGEFLMHERSNSFSTKNLLDCELHTVLITEAK